MTENEIETYINDASPHLFRSTHGTTKLGKDQRPFGSSHLRTSKQVWVKEDYNPIGKKHALKKFDQFALNTSCFWGCTRSNITPVKVVQFHEIFVTKIINKFIYLFLIDAAKIS